MWWNLEDEKMHVYVTQCMCMCPAGGSSKTMTSSTVVRCGCGTSSCFECRDKPHWPATCTEARSYDQMRQQRGKSRRMKCWFTVVSFRFRRNSCVTASRIVQTGSELGK